MKRLKRFYFIPIIIALAVAAFLICLLFPPTFYFKAIIIVLFPLIILAIGFRIITYHRIQIIRNQLYQIVQILEEFDIDEPRKVVFDDSPFPIFNELNEYLLEIIDRVRSNYRSNKQFTQNASHELQTPLAIIKGHVEILLQSQNIGEKEFESLAIVLQNTNRLSKLNSTLILLSKIEHQRFSDTLQVNIATIVDELLLNFHDSIQLQGITIRKDYKTPFVYEMSETLAEILIANLIQNAIRYNTPKGNITITIDENYFVISNPGKPLKVNPDNLFKRFKRASELEESLGLGLSIVQRICEQSELKVSYQEKDGIHLLRVEK